MGTEKAEAAQNDAYIYTQTSGDMGKIINHTEFDLLMNRVYINV